ncbi:hypothetical protein V1517DRAFT_196354 [Lipomyces orientalis]|uniref:Uncharacterized protein n=1 Tax=Lipomyces orientalis TaxID=1233043 RepID=A0ACC3TIJ5_9ASCO
MIIGSVMQCESRNFTMFLISRFILGFGLTFCTTAAPSLVAELCRPKERTTITAICNKCWFIGSIVAAWITFGTRRIESTWSWRIPSLLQMVPSLCQLAAIWLLPESPRARTSETIGLHLAFSLLNGQADTKEINVSQI